jgi:hypothetical protein
VSDRGTISQYRSDDSVVMASIVSRCANRWRLRRSWRHHLGQSSVLFNLGSGYSGQVPALPGTGPGGGADEQACQPDPVVCKRTINNVRRAVGVLTISPGKSRSIAGPCDTGLPQVEAHDHVSGADFQAGSAGCRAFPQRRSISNRSAARPNHALAGRAEAGLRDGQPRGLPRQGWVGGVWHPIDPPEGYHTAARGRAGQCHAPVRSRAAPGCRVVGLRQVDGTPHESQRARSSPIALS